MPIIIPAIRKLPQQLPSLPDVERKAKAVAQLLNTQVLISSQATLATVTHQLTKARLIHFATHGLSGFADSSGKKANK